MTIKKLIAGATLVLATLFSTLAMTSPVTANPAFVTVGSATSTPIGHAEFCKGHREDCSLNANVVDLVELDETRWTQLLTINATVNANIVPVTDAELYQVGEFWTYPRGYGDCEDIALAKRRELIAKGWAASTLLMAVVREANGNGHAVLMVKTDRGDLVLDNQDGLVKLWSDTPYHFIKRQSQADQAQWVDILDDRTVIVAASN